MNEQKEFMEKINRVYKECDGMETYGNTTEFYDEDGCIIMTVVEGEETTKFDFGQNNIFNMTNKNKIAVV